MAIDRVGTQNSKRRIIDQRTLSDHERKNLMILEIIRRRGPVARADIARLVNLNNVTVTSYVDQYIKKGIIHEAGIQTSTGGRKPTLVDLEPNIAFAIGVGLDAANFTAVLCNLKGDIIHKTRLERTAKVNEKPIDSILDIVGTLIKESNVDPAKVHGVGVGVPGIVNHRNGTVRWPRGLLSGDLQINVSISNMIQERFGIPVILDNDANAAVFAEQWALSNGLDVESAVYLYSGSGCGLYIGGQIYRGYNGSAGELLFDLAEEDPVQWLSTAVKSGDWSIDLGITHRSRLEVTKHKKSKLFEICGGAPEKISLESVMSAAVAGDEFVVTILTDAGRALGRKAAVIVNLLNPEMLIVGGGVEKAGVIFLDAVRDEVRTASVPEASDRLRIVPSKLGEAAVPLGAAALIIQNFFVSH